MGDVQATAGWTLGSGLVLLIHCVFLSAKLRRLLYSEANHVEVVVSEGGIEDSGVCIADSGSGVRGAGEAIWARASRMTCAISSWADCEREMLAWTVCDSDCGTDGNLA